MPHGMRRRPARGMRRLAGTVPAVDGGRYLRSAAAMRKDGIAAGKFEVRNIGVTERREVLRLAVDFHRRTRCVAEPRIDGLRTVIRVRRAGRR